MSAFLALVTAGPAWGALTVTPSGSWHLFAGHYVQARYAGPDTFEGMGVCFTRDAGETVIDLGWEELAPDGTVIASGGLGSSNAPSDCREDVSAIFPWQLDEGPHTYRSFATGSVSGVVYSEPWTVWIDRTGPSVAATNGSLPAGWAGTEASIAFNAVDLSGVPQVRLLIDGIPRATVTPACQPGVHPPCPDLYGHVFEIDTSALSEGTHTWQLEATDVAENVTLTPATAFTVDRQAPDVYLDGQLYEARATPLPPDYYDLSIDARSSDPARSTSGVDEVRVYVDGTLRLTALPSSTCSGSACDVDTDFDLDAYTLTGVHTITVQAEDAAGNVRTLTWSVDFSGEPTDLDLPSAFARTAAAPAPERSGSGRGCGFVRSEAARTGLAGTVREVTTGRWRTKRASGPETTERYREGGYRVTRCTDAGALIISQNVGPVPVPGGGYALLEVGRTMPEGDGYGTSWATYADPEDPSFARAWARSRARALAISLPPTAR